MLINLLFAAAGFCNFGLVFGLLYDPKECKASREGAEYMGSVNTVNGIECQRWDTQEPHAHEFIDPKLFPDASFEAVSNYCRNPDLDSAPWCYTTDPEVRYDFCDVPWCPIYPECDTGIGPYIGSKHVTQSGLECHYWDAMSQEQLQSVSLYDVASLNENYCRNPDEKEGGSWCFVGEGLNDWEYCVISVCKPSASCTTSDTGTEYVGKRGITRSGRPCQRWERQLPHTHGYTDGAMYPDSTVTEAENFCRNPDNSRNAVWCYTTDPDQEWEYCDVPICSGCKDTVDGRGYTGTEAATVTGDICRDWASHNVTDSNLFPDVNVDEASNYCRNPDNKPNGVWCYTGDTLSEWGYCDVQLCQEDCDKDSKERRTHKHVLHVGIDGLHASCWQNAPGGAPNLLRLASEGSYTYKARAEIFTFSAPNWSAHLCGMGNEETGVTSNDWEAPWMGKQEDITPVTGLNYPMPCVFYYLKGMDANIRTASFINWPWIYEMSGRNSPGSTDYDFYCRGTSSSGETCDWDVVGNVTEYIRNITNVAERSYTFVHIDHLDGSGHGNGWCTEEYLNTVDTIDTMIGVILDSIEGLDVLFTLSSDHGGTADGSHGRQEDEHLLIPLFFKGPGVKQNYQLEDNMQRNRDIIPSVVWAMGIEGSPYWYGDVLYDIFE